MFYFAESFNKIIGMVTQDGKHSVTVLLMSSIVLITPDKFMVGVRQGAVFISIHINAFSSSEEILFSPNVEDHLLLCLNTLGLNIKMLI